MKDTSVIATANLLRLRNLLNQISQISFAFSQLNRKYPIDTLTHGQLNDLYFAYAELVMEAKKICAGFDIKNETL